MLAPTAPLLTLAEKGRIRSRFARLGWGSVAHTEAGKIRGTRFGAVSCTKKWIFDSFFKGILRVHAGAPPQAAVHACTTRLGSFYCGWLVYVHPLCFEPLFSGQFLLGHPFRDLPISFPMMCHSMVYVSRSAKIVYFSRQRHPCLPLRSRTHTFLGRKVGLGFRRFLGVQRTCIFSRQRRPCLPLRPRTHTFLRRKVGLGLRRAYGGRKILRTLFRPRFP